MTLLSLTCCVLFEACTKYKPEFLQKMHSFLAGLSSLKTSGWCPGENANVENDNPPLNQVSLFHGCKSNDHLCGCYRRYGPVECHFSSLHLWVPSRSTVSIKWYAAFFWSRVLKKQNYSWPPKSSCICSLPPKWTICALKFWKLTHRSKSWEQLGEPGGFNKTHTAKILFNHRPSVRFVNNVWYNEGFSSRQQ